MAIFVHLGFFALVSYLFMFTGRSILALRADPFGFFISSRLRVWGRGVVAWVGALIWDPSSLTSFLSCLSAGSLWGRSLYALSLVSPDSFFATYQIRSIVRFLLY